MILFITRKYPPSIGGMQKLSFELTTNIGKKINSHIISWGHSQVFFPYFYLVALLRSLLIIIKNDINLIHIGDPLLSPLGLIFKYLFKKPIVANIHGKDITFPNEFYNFAIYKILKKYDGLICISKHIKGILISKGIPEDKIITIPVGINPENFKAIINKRDSLKKIEGVIKKNLRYKKILLSVGRLIERKGFAHFIENILPRVLKRKKDIVYFIVGDGKHRKKIRKIICQLNLQDKVFLFRQVNSNLLHLIYSSSDLFIMPNIPVRGDMEGFGIVILEAGLHKLPTVASDLEGIRDAIKNEENGFLVKYNDFNKFSNVILSLLDNDKARKALGIKAKIYVSKYFYWNIIVDKYISVFSNLISSRTVNKMACSIKKL